MPPLHDGIYFCLPRDSYPALSCVVCRSQAANPTVIHRSALWPENRTRPGVFSLAYLLSTAQNRGMYVSPEVISLILTAIGAVISIVGMNQLQIRGLEKRMDKQFERVDTRFDKVDGELHEIRRDIGDVKERIARLEGPKKELQFQ